MTAKQDEAQDDLLGKVAWLYYKERMRQEDIGHALGLSRTKIQRMLERANRSTIVQVEIRHPRYNLLSVEAQLTGAYQLTDAVVVPAVANSNVVAIAAIAKAGAAYLSRTVQGGGWDVLGIGWGSTTSQLAEEFAPPSTSCVRTVVSLLGTLSTSTAGHPSVPAETIAKKIGSNFYHIWAPAIAQSAEGASAFLAEPRINEVIRLARTCKLSVISIGEFGVQSPLVRMGYYPRRTCPASGRREPSGIWLALFSLGMERLSRIRLTHGSLVSGRQSLSRRTVQSRGSVSLALVVGWVSSKL